MNSGCDCNANRGCECGWAGDDCVFEVVLEIGIEGVDVADEDEWNDRDWDKDMVGGGGWNVAWRASSPRANKRAPRRLTKHRKAPMGRATRSVVPVTVNTKRNNHAASANGKLSTTRWNRARQ